MTQTRDEANEAAAHGHFDVRVYGQVWLEVCPELGTVTLVGRATETEVSLDIEKIDEIITAFTSVHELLREGK
jgi:hypothetical protein